MLPIDRLDEQAAAAQALQLRLCVRLLGQLFTEGGAEVFGDGRSQQEQLLLDGQVPEHLLRQKGGDLIHFAT